MLAMIVVHGLFKVCIASEASYRLVEDRRSGALELSLSTSLGVRDILHGQLTREFRNIAAHSAQPRNELTHWLRSRRGRQRLPQAILAAR